MTYDVDLFVAVNPANELDARWFRFEDDAYAHFCDYGDDYLYTAFNDVEGWSRSVNDDFKDRLDDARAHCRFDREASKADRLHDERMEGVRA